MNASRIRQNGVRQNGETAVGDILWTNFLKYRELIHLGEVAAESKLEEIKKLISPKFRKKILQWPKKIFYPKQKVRLLHFKRTMTSS
jgi:hypothetical protein